TQAKAGASRSVCYNADWPGASRTVNKKGRFMSGDHDKLRQALDDLQAQLAELRQLDASAAARLEATIGDARSVLNTSADDREPETVGDQFSEALLHYEAQHPILAGNLRSVNDALAQIGI